LPPRSSRTGSLILKLWPESPPLPSLSRSRLSRASAHEEVYVLPSSTSSLTPSRLLAPLLLSPILRLHRSQQLHSFAACLAIHSFPRTPAVFPATSPFRFVSFGIAYSLPQLGMSAAALHILCSKSIHKWPCCTLERSIIWLRSRRLVDHQVRAGANVSITRRPSPHHPPYQRRIQNLHIHSTDPNSNCISSNLNALLQT
jgi:hypothetical protein